MKITCSCPIHCTVHVVLGNGDICCFESSLSLNLFSRVGMIICQPHGGTTFKVRNHLSHEDTYWMSAPKYADHIWDVFWYFTNQMTLSSLGPKRFLFIREIFSSCSLFIYTFFQLISSHTDLYKDQNDCVLALESSVQKCALGTNNRGCIKYFSTYISGVDWDCLFLLVPFITHWREA